MGSSGFPENPGSPAAGSCVLVARRPIGGYSFAWLFSTPEWMRGDDRALRLVRWLRVLVLSWNVGSGIFIVVRIFW